MVDSVLALQLHFHRPSVWIWRRHMQTARSNQAGTAIFVAALVDTMMTVAQAEALANWVALHK